MEKERTQERRKGNDRRGSVVDRRLGLDRRRGPGRRLADDRTPAEEGHMSDEQFDFLMAIDEYKRSNSRPFPTWTEVLDAVLDPGDVAQVDRRVSAMGHHHARERLDGAELRVG
ncbi:MAG: hypothetical protein ACYSUX_05675, partial [Planctomycetota bacterium]